MCPIYLHTIIRVLHSPVNMVNPISFSKFFTTPLISQIYIALNSKICITKFHQTKHLSSLRNFLWYALCFLVTEVTQKIKQYIRQSNPDCYNFPTKPSVSLQFKLVLTRKKLSPINGICDSTLLGTSRSAKSADKLRLTDRGEQSQTGWQ